MVYTLVIRSSGRMQGNSTDYKVDVGKFFQFINTNKDYLDGQLVHFIVSKQPVDQNGDDPTFGGDGVEIRCSFDVTGYYDTISEHDTNESHMHNVGIIQNNKDLDVDVDRGINLKVKGHKFSIKKPSDVSSYLLQVQFHNTDTIYGSNLIHHDYMNEHILVFNFW